MIVVDSHSDLAWNILAFGRDYTRGVAETRAIEAGTETPIRNENTMLGWPEWVAGRVGILFATLFAPPARHKKFEWSTLRYETPEQAHLLYQDQLDAYARLTEQHPDKFRVIRNALDLHERLEEWKAYEASLEEVESGDGRAVSSERGDGQTTIPAIGLVLLMEGADGVREPAELGMWFESGVRIVGPAWIGTQYTGGTREPGGFTDKGFALLEAMADARMILDFSHLAEQAAHEALDRYTGAVIASHSNPRSLVPRSANPDRHLTDELIRGIADREGVIGIVLYNKFLDQEWEPGRELTIDRVVAHIDYVCQLLGSAKSVGIGSDFDGGFGRESVPTELDSVANLRFIGEALSRANYTEGDVDAILGGNWIRLLTQALPETI